MNKGRIVQVMGPVVDVLFEDGVLPHIKDALKVKNGDRTCVMEVSQHLGNSTVRCIMLAASEGLCRDMEVEATGKGIQVPVGDKTLGRLFNVLGETIDGGESLEGEEHWVIHRDPPSFADQKPVVEILETGIKVIDLLAPYAKGGKSDCSEERRGKDRADPGADSEYCHRTRRLLDFHRRGRAFQRGK